MKNNSNLQYFVGKPCSIFTGPLNRDFRMEGPKYLQQFYHYFLGIVESIDDQGLLLKQIGSGLKIYCFKHSLIAIAEEEMLDPDKDAETIKEFQPIPENKAVQPVSDKKLPTPPEMQIPDFLDIDTITNIANNLKNTFGEGK